MGCSQNNHMLPPSQIIKGIASYIPGLYDLYVKKKGTGIQVSAQHYYSWWLYLLLIIDQHGLTTKFPVVAELGPGDTLGSGLSALLTGSQKYFALDVVNLTDLSSNVTLLDEITHLLSARFSARQLLKVCDFPDHILTSQRLSENLTTHRINAIKQALTTPQNTPDIEIKYYCPWQEESVIKRESTDLIFSWAVMEHVDDLKKAYAAMFSWLKPGGIMAHQIDFRCHQFGTVWNEHWTYADSLWAIVSGKRTFSLNREPHSAHLDLISKAGFRIIGDHKSSAVNTLNRERLAQRFRGITDEDLTTDGTFILAIKS